MAEQNAERAGARAALRAELQRREAEAGTAVSELQRAKAALAQQMARLRRDAMTAASAARPRRSAAVGTDAAVAPPAKRAKGTPVDGDTLAQLQRSLKVSWQREQGEHDEASLRAALVAHGTVEHIVLRAKRGKPPASAVVVMATAAGAAAAVRGPTGLKGAPLLVTPLPAVANMAALDGGTEAAAAAAVNLRRGGIAASAPPNPGRGESSAAARQAPSGHVRDVPVTSFPAAPSSFPGVGTSARPVTPPTWPGDACSAQVGAARSRDGDVDAESRADKRARMLAAAEAEDE